MIFYKSLLYFLFYFTFATNLKFSKSHETATTVKEVLVIMKECASMDLTVCLKEKLIKLVEKLPKVVEITSGITLRGNNIEEKRSSKNLEEIQLPQNNILRSKLLNQILIEKIKMFLNSHLLEIKIPDETIKEYTRSFQEGRKKKRKSIVPYILLFKAKALALGTFFIKFISLLAFKALLLAKIALVLTMGISLKKWSEVSRHPAPSYNTHWRRILKNDIPYSNQISPYSTIK